MRCLKPTKFPNSNGEVACGNCIPCRITKRTRWRTRLMLEKKYWSNRVLFVTLTYAPDNLPDAKFFTGGNLYKEHLQKFLKRVRRRLNYSGDDREIKYYGVGEYGEKSSRAHYHVILYNMDLNDKEIIESCWSYGFVHFGDGNKETLNYTLGYTLKKMTSEKDFPDGRNPEFAIMSKALGARYLDAFAKRLIKHKLYPSRSLTQYEQFILHSDGLNPENLGWKFWDGVFFIENVRCSFDAFIMKKLAELVNPYLRKLLEINSVNVFENAQNFINSQKKWKVHKSRLEHDAFLDTISFKESPDYEETYKKAQKIHWQSKSRRKHF